MEAWRDQTSLLVETELVVSEVGVGVVMVDVRDGRWVAWSWWCAGWERLCGIRIRVVEARVWLRARLVLI